MFIRTYAEVIAQRPVAFQSEPTEEDLVLDRFSNTTADEQGGAGVISWVSGKVGNKLYPKWRPQPDSKGTEYEGKTEHHYPYHNFCGPGTFLRLRLERGDEPVDYPDACAKVHDIEYQEIHDGIKDGRYSEADVKRLVRASDKKLMNCLSKDRHLSSLIRSFIVRKIIHSKTKLEDLKVLKASSFVKPDATKPAPPPSAQVTTSDPADTQGGGEYLIRTVESDEAPVYACCEACHKKGKFCMKKPAYQLKTKMFKGKK